MLGCRMAGDWIGLVWEFRVWSGFGLDVLEFM